MVYLMFNVSMFLAHKVTKALNSVFNVCLDEPGANQEAEKQDSEAGVYEERVKTVLDGTVLFLIYFASWGGYH